MRLYEINHIPDYVDRNWTDFKPYWFKRTYEVIDNVGPMEIRVYSDSGMLRIVGVIQNKLMAYLTLMKAEYGYQVQALQVDPQFRGKGVALYLYKTALKKLSIAIISDSEQTSGGIGIWKKLQTQNDIDVKSINTSTGKIVDENPYDNRSVRFIATKRGA